MFEKVVQVCRGARMLSTLGIVLSAFALVMVPVSVTPNGVSLRAAVCQTGSCMESEGSVCAWGEENLDEGYSCASGECMTCTAYAAFCFNGEAKIDGYIETPQ